MYLIDTSYFVREYSIPNINELQSETATNFGYYIDDKVRLFLQQTLGYANFNDLDGNITDGVLGGGAPQKWLDLVNGTEYTKGGKTLKWNGLLYTNGTFKKSLLTPYVFHEWLRENATTNTGQVIDTANMQRLSLTPRLTDVWNAFVYQYQKDRRNYLPKVKQEGNAKYIDFLFESNDNYVSMLRFLQDNSDSYDPITYKLFPIVNNFGL